MKPYVLAFLALAFAGCKPDVEPVAEAPKFNQYDVLAEIREAGWEVSNEDMKPDHRGNGEQVLYFDVNKVLYCSIWVGEKPDQPDAFLKFVQEGGYTVYSLPLNQDAEDWEIACEEELGAICSVPFEQKMLMVEEWQNKFMEDSGRILKTLASN